MTLEQLIARKREEIAAKLAERAAFVTELAEIRGKEETTEADEARVAEVRGLKDTLDAAVRGLEVKIAEAEAELAADKAAAVAIPVNTGVTAGATQRDARVVVTKEERTYSSDKSRRGEASFFADAHNYLGGDVQARTRLERHANEVRAEGEMTERATTTTSFAGLVVPQYLVDQAALVARAGRPFANTVTNLPLPSQGMSFLIPRGTTGAATAIQATENASVQSTDEVWANVTVPVATIAGQQDVSRQSLERGTPGIDELIYMDLAGAYAANLDSQVLTGSGASGQMLGVQNTGSVNQSTAFVAAATTTTFYTKTGGQINAVETTRFMAPTAIAMHPRRWNWLLTQLDSSTRPLVVPNSNGPFNALGITGTPQDTTSSSPVGSLFGLPVITDANIPTAVGSGPEDIVIVYRREDLLLWEDGDGMPRQLRFEQTLGNQLTVKLVVYGYAAFTAGRYPAAVGLVGGNSAGGFGLIAPTF